MAKVTLKHVRRIRLSLNLEEAKALYYSMDPKEVRKNASPEEAVILEDIANRLDEDMRDTLSEAGIDF